MKTEELVIIGGLAFVAYLALRKPQTQVVYQPAQQQQSGSDWVGQLLRGLLGSGSAGYQYTDPSAAHYVTSDGLTAG